MNSRKQPSENCRTGSAEHDHGTACCCTQTHESHQHVHKDDADHFCNDRSHEEHSHDEHPHDEHPHEEHSHAHESVTKGCCCHGDEQHLAGARPASANGKLKAQPVPAGSQFSQWRIDAMDCPVEENLIRKQLASMNEVSALEFNLMQRTLSAIHLQGAQSAIETAIASLGMAPVAISEDESLAREEPPSNQKHKRTLLFAVAGLFLAIGAEFTHYLGWPELCAAVPAIAAILLCGLGTYRKGLIAIRHGELNINALMSIAVTGAAIIGQWPEAAMVMALFTISELIEARSLDRARNAIRSLLQLAPSSTTVLQSNGSWQEVAPEKVNVGDVVRVRPGQRIALDGTITEGVTTINQSAVTGESLPVDKKPGDTVFAGTLNESGEFQFKVTATTQNSTLARIIHAVEEAQSERAPTQRFVDQFARYYTPGVVLIAIAIALLGPLFGMPWLGASGSIYKALVILVIACPCALVISTPVTVVSALTAASKFGLLVKGGVYMENGRFLRWLALDKTGTITFGKPVQTEAIVLEDKAGAKNARQLAASLASRSDHPVSIAIAQAAEAEHIGRLPVESFAAVAGQGTRGSILGQSYHLGNTRMIRELGLLTPEVEGQITALEAKGQTVVTLASNQEALALFAVADTIKPSSCEAIAELHHLGVKTLMLSGDNPHSAQSIAEQAGINEARGNQLPEDKRAAIEKKIQEMTEAGDTKGMIGMVGDGINDAPALARANIGFAMGAAGTDTAMETADVAIMDDDLRKIPLFIRLSRRTHRILVQNISLALGIKAVFLVLTILGYGTMWMAVFADVGTSLLVVFNGLRMLRTPRKAP